MNETEEQWKDIKDYEDLYEVSTHGRVRSKRKGVIMKWADNGAGYMNVSLCRNGKLVKKYIHRLVA
jgi:hypothetical protein